MSHFTHLFIFVFFHSPAPHHPPPLNHFFFSFSFLPSYLFSRAHKQAGQWSRCSWRSAPAKHNSVVTLLGMKQNASARKRTGRSRAESFEEQRGHPPSSRLDISLSRLLHLSFFFFFWLILNNLKKKINANILSFYRSDTVSIFRSSFSSPFFVLKCMMEL